MVDNRGGGCGPGRHARRDQGPPDGYTLLLGHTGSISINPSLYANAGFDPRKDFAAIGLIASMPVVLIAHPSFPAKTIARVDRAAESQSRQDTMSAPRRSAPAATCRPNCSSRWPASMSRSCPTRARRRDERSARRPRAGRVRRACRPRSATSSRASCARSRSQATGAYACLPDVPTCAESGMPGFESVLHYGAARARRHAAPDRRQAQRRTAQARRQRRGEEANPVRGRRSDDLDARTNTPPTSTRKRPSGRR